MLSASSLSLHMPVVTTYHSSSFRFDQSVVNSMVESNPLAVIDVARSMASLADFEANVHTPQNGS